MKFSAPIKAMSRWIRRRFSSSLEDEVSACTFDSTFDSIKYEALTDEYDEESLASCDLSPINSNDDLSIISRTDTVIHYRIPKSTEPRTNCGLPVAIIFGSQEEIPLIVNSPEKASSSSWKETSTLIDSPDSQTDYNVPPLYDVRFHLKEIPRRYKYVVALTNGLKTIKYDKSLCEQKKPDNFSTHIKEKVLGRKEKCFKLGYFQRLATTISKLPTVFEAFNMKDFQIIRDALEINDNEFKGAFDQFYAEDNNVYSPSGKFQLRFIDYEQAFFLHQKVSKAKAHLLKNRGTAIQQFIGLSRIGTDFYAIEYSDYDESKLDYKCRLMNTKKKGLRYYMEEKKTNIQRRADRDSEIRRLFGIENPDPQKKILLNDLKFLKHVGAGYYRLTIGRKDENFREPTMGPNFYKFKGWISNTHSNQSKNLNRMFQKELKRLFDKR